MNIRLPISSDLLPTRSNNPNVVKYRENDGMVNTRRIVSPIAQVRQKTSRTNIFDDRVTRFSLGRSAIANESEINAQLIKAIIEQI